VSSPSDFKKLLGALWDELYWAKFYYTLFKETSRLCKEHEAAVQLSPFFWHFTLRAHCQTALVYLHRIYDQNKDSFNIHRFLLTIRDNPKMFDPENVRKRREHDPHVDYLIRAIGSIDSRQLDRDIEFTSIRNTKVENLRVWRDRVVFHNDERELFRQTPFEEDHPLPFADIEKLLERGFGILNRYSAYFDTTGYSDNCQANLDVKSVFAALMNQPNIGRRCAEGPG
jgi:hypothetical protein